MKTLLIILAIIAVLFIFMMFLIRSKPYTNQEWEDKTASDFKKIRTSTRRHRRRKRIKKGRYRLPQLPFKSRSKLVQQRINASDLSRPFQPIIKTKRLQNNLRRIMIP